MAIVELFKPNRKKQFKVEGKKYLKIIGNKNYFISF